MTFTVEQARKYAGLTQKMVADKMNIDTSTYARYEHNSCKMSFEMACLFSSVVGIDFDSIIFFTRKL